ncbi:MAG: Fe-S cluster assembly protein SufD [Thermomicrobiales bacterium]|nr:Fe-S cluster assembly protein SufD [Thermomicrobiales bacterium]MCO5226724.1 Fe-S cluster assembly protein SufD [Thermomicrobiales bacterium]
MSVTASSVENLAAFTADTVRALSASRNEPEWMLQKRLDAFAIYEQLPMPARTDEEWRRTDLRMLKPEHFAIETALQTQSGTLETILSGSEHQMQFGAADQRAGLSVVSDHGTVWHEAGELPEGVIFTDLTTAVSEHPDLVREYFMTQAVPADFGKFQALHAALWQTGTFLYVPEGVTVDLPFRSFALQTTTGTSLFTHSLVVVEKQAEAFFVDAFQSDTAEEASFTSAVVELFLADDAKLRYVQVQDWGRHVWNFMTQRAILGTDSELKSLEVTLGSRFTKNSIGSHLRGENALAEMLGIYFGDQKQFFDHHTWQLHESPYATSDLEFKGALKEGARSVYSGLIKVEEGAQKTDAFQQNRNLVLDRTSRADSIPNLEIAANDVRCTHGATVSQVEEEHLFYLESRGIPRAEAQKLVVEGFFRPVIDRIPVEEIQDFLQGAIARKVGY